MDRNNEMHKEEARLATFVNWPRNIPISPLQLVTAGLCYTGEGDQVKCFSCRGRILNWEVGDIPMQEHRRHFPSCAFVTNPNASGNVHFTFGEAVAVATSNGDNALRVDSENVMDTEDPSLALDGSNAGTVRDAASVGIPNGHIGIPNGHIGPVTEPADPGVFTHGRMVDRMSRLRSLQHWPMRGTIDIDRVAEHGMYFTGDLDKIRCFYCSGSMINWDAGDDPVHEHDKYFGDRCNRGRVPSLGENIPMTRNPTPPEGHNSTTYERLNIITDRPKHSQYVTEAARLESFRNWPIEEAQSKNTLVAAGFYYTGTIKNSMGILK